MRYLLLSVLLFTTFLLVGNTIKKPTTTVVVKLKKSTLKSTVLAEMQSVEDTIELVQLFPHLQLKSSNIVPDKYDLSRFYKLTVDSEETLDYIRKLNTLDEVEYAEDYPVSVVLEDTFVYNDPLVANQYYIDKIKAYLAHSITTGDTNIVIGIVDGGVDLLHEDLKDNLKYNYGDPVNGVDDDGDGYVDNYYGWDVANNDMNPQSDVSQHGTNISGMASAVGNNEKGITSIGFKTKLLQVKAMDAYGYIVAGYEGIVYAAEHGCSIINCSWGNNTYTQFGQDVINYVTEHKGCLVIAAGGNKNASQSGMPYELFYPAAYDNVLSVAATNSVDELWDGSSYAVSMDVSAPGEQVYSTDDNSTYGYHWGTSSAAGLVSGLAALVKGQRPWLTPTQLMEQIRVTSDNIDTIPENEYYARQMGYGRVNAYKALIDTVLPAVRIRDVNITDNKSASLLSGDTLFVTFSAVNYLSQVSNTVIRLTTNSDFVEPVSNFFSTGVLNTFDTVKVTYPLILKVLPEIPFNEKIWLVFDMQADGYSDYQVIEVVLNKNFINIDVPTLTTTITSDGNIGFADRETKLGEGIEYKGEEILNIGGIFLATGINNMCSALGVDNDFEIEQVVDTVINDSFIISTAEYGAKDEMILPVKVKQMTVLSNDDESSTIIYKYRIENTSDYELKGVKLSQFIDWDLDNLFANTVYSDRSLNMIYTCSNSDNVIYSGVSLLNDMEPVYYGFDLVSGGNGGIDITEDFNNEQKWLAMTNSRESAGNDADTINVAQMLTSDYFTIGAKDTFEIAFAHVIADNLYELKTETLKALNDYRNIISVEENKEVFVSVYPNPAQDIITVESAIFMENTEISIIDISGNKVITRTVSGVKSVTLDIGVLKRGVYILIVKNNDSELRKRIVRF